MKRIEEMELTGPSPIDSDGVAVNFYLIWQFLIHACDVEALEATKQL